MPESQKQPAAESHQKVQIITTTAKRRSFTRQQSGDRNYKTLYSGRYILNRDINGIKQMIDRNFKKIW